MSLLLPNKYMREQTTILAAGAAVLRELQRPRTISWLRDRLRSESSIPTMHRLALALDLLYALGLVEFEDGRIRRPG